METRIRPYGESDLMAIQKIWNSVVEGGDAFPGETPLSLQECRDYFARQSLTAVAETEGRVAGLYILHPNNIGRAGHIANASYAVASSARGRGVGEALVRHSLSQFHAAPEGAGARPQGVRPHGAAGQDGAAGEA